MPFDRFLSRTAFATWILALVLFRMVLRYGGYASLATGACLVAGPVVYATVRNPTELTVPFEDGFMEFHWGWTFWLSIATGHNLSANNTTDSINRLRIS